MIKTYLLEDADEWDYIVMSFECYDVYYLSGYVKAFEINGDGKAMLIYYQDNEDSDNDKTRAINVVMKRDLGEFPPFKFSKETWFDIVTPYGYGGFIVEGNNYLGIKNEYEQFCRNENIVSEFVRFHPVLENWHNVSHIYDVTYLGKTVYMDTANPETIWKNLSSKNRNVIRKAQKEGLVVYWSRDLAMIEPFMNIYNATMNRDSAAEYYYFGREFYESVLNDLKYNAMWFYTKKEQQIVSIAIFLFCNGQMHYHLSASMRDYSYLAPSNLLLYEAAIWASKNGYKTLHMGGGVGSREDGLYKFKKAFNRNEDMRYCIGKKIYNLEIYQRLVHIREQGEKKFNSNTSFFPIYRA